MFLKISNFDVNYVTFFVSENIFNGSHAHKHGQKSLQNAKLGI